MENRIAFYLDEFFKIVIIFFISLVFFSALDLSINISLTLSSILTLMLCIIFYIIRTKKYNKKKLKYNEIKILDEIQEAFSYASQKEINEYIKILFNGELNSKKEIILQNNILIIPKFDNEVFTLENLKNIYRTNKNRRLSKIIILCTKVEEECTKYVQNYKKISYEIKTLYELYTDYIKPQNLLPNFDYEKPKIEKFSFSKFLILAFKRQKAKTYFFCGTILLFSSFFVPLRIYYLITSFIMFIFSLLCIILHTKKVNN